MARYAVNRLLNRFPCVAFLETDVGQTELTPAGMVALHLVHALLNVSNTSLTDLIYTRSDRR